MGVSLQSSRLEWLQFDRPSRNRRLALAALGLGAVLLLGLPLLRHGSAPQERRDALRAEISRLEGEISAGASDVAALRQMADQTRAELDSLRKQKAAAQDLPDGAVPGGQLAFVAAEQSPKLQPEHASKSPPDLAPTVTVSGPRNPRTARDFMAVARQQLSEGRAKEAGMALEMAETRALNDSSAYAEDYRHGGMVKRIREARRLLNAGNATGSERVLALATAGKR